MYINSSIIENNELEFIISIIKKRMNKEIKEIRKLYQASIDGFKPSIFHQKCNNIPNILILYKTIGNRRFGGFTTLGWKNRGDCIQDNNCFLFSLDKEKIYPPKNDNYYQIADYSYDGPSFAIKNYYLILGNDTLRTNENKYQFIFEGESNALSEDGNYKGVSAKENEVFEVKFF